MDITPEHLETLLRAAEKAHGAYEATLGHRDEDWPKWYAEYICAELKK